MPPGAYQPYVPTRRPGSHPIQKPRYRVLVHRQFLELWDQLPLRVGLESAQQFFDFVSNDPGRPPATGRTTVLAGKAGRPKGEGLSRTIHYEIAGAGRINFQYNDSFTGGASGDAHPIVFILSIDLSSH